MSGSGSSAYSSSSMPSPRSNDDDANTSTTPRPVTAQGTHFLPEDERRQAHLQNIADLGSRAEDCWAEYRESEIMKCRCELVHWQSRQKALESEVAYAAEVVSRKTDVLRKLEKHYGEIDRQPQPVQVHGPRASVRAAELAANYKAPINQYGRIHFARWGRQGRQHQGA